MVVVAVCRCYRVVVLVVNQFSEKIVINNKNIIIPTANLYPSAPAVSIRRRSLALNIY